MLSKFNVVKWFLLFTTLFTSGVFIWLILTPSLASTFFIFWFTKQRFIIILFFVLILLLLLILLGYSNNQKLQHYFEMLMASKAVYIISISITSILFIILFGVLLHSYGALTMFFERISPILIYGFLVSLEVTLFQEYLSKGDFRRSIFYRDEASYITPNGRDLRLDFLRGLFVVIMIIDHIGGRSILYYVTFGNQFFTSVTEGFILVSGIVTGLVYSNLIKRDGIGIAFKKSARRLLSLYLITISLSLLILFLGEHFGVMSSKGVDLAQPIQPILNLLLFRNLYDHGQILVLYCYMFLLLPFAIILLEGHKTGWLIGLSSLIYLMNVIYPDTLLIQVHTYMSISGIQFIFFGGILLGYNNNIRKVQNKISSRWLLLTGFMFLCLILLWNFLQDPTIIPFLHPSDQMLATMQLFFEKSFVAPGRILASIIVFGFLYILLTLSWKRIDNILGWLILPFGENALFAFTFHLIIYMVFEIVSKYFGYEMHSYWLNGFFQILVVFIVWFCIKKDFFTPKEKNRKLYYRIPGIILLAFISFEILYKIPWIQTTFEPIFNLSFGK